MGEKLRRKGSKEKDGSVQGEIEASGPGTLSLALNMTVIGMERNNDVSLMRDVSQTTTQRFSVFKRPHSTAVDMLFGGLVV
mmetsp:Transcript_1743/g.2444  ORF Transcript_1743/g.2444 Transcript_1743/m.2444 type:complete len:81 (+) Transcript_1743:708-950(+)